jgi:DNA invertase Pin-like site-specific DNA recombinase
VSLTLKGRLVYDLTMKLIGYIRVSTDKQFNTGAGLEAQRHYLELEATRRGATLEIVSELEATSGKSTRKRPALAEALARLDKGEAQGLIVSKLDRLSRSVADFLDILERSRKGKWSLVIGDLSLDTSSPMGEAMATITATFAQLERKRIGERTKEGLAIKKAQGVKLGAPRLLNPEIRSRIEGELATSTPLAVIARRLNEEAIPSAKGGKWYASTIKKIALGSVA